MIKSIDKIKNFLKEIADKDKEWEWDDGEPMYDDMKNFLDYLD